jgi:2-oxoglutarate dehydrogenase E1 component
VGFHGFDPDRDMDREMNFKGVHTGGNKGFLEDLTNMPGKVTLRKVVQRLRETYCGTIGVEYMHIGSVHQCNWIRERVENPNFLKVDKEKKVRYDQVLLYLLHTRNNSFANLRWMGGRGPMMCSPILCQATHFRTSVFRGYL